MSAKASKGEELIAQTHFEEMSLLPSVRCNRSDLTSAKSENPGDDICQNPAVPTELEQVIGDNIDRPEANPARKGKGFV